MLKYPSKVPQAKWRIPKIWVPPNHHPFLDGIVPNKNYPLLGYHPFWETSEDQTSQSSQRSKMQRGADVAGCPFPTLEAISSLVGNVGIATIPNNTPHKGMVFIITMVYTTYSW